MLKTQRVPVITVVQFLSNKVLNTKSLDKIKNIYCMSPEI